MSAGESGAAWAYIEISHGCEAPLGLTFEGMAQFNLKCDFCGREVKRVRRVALDRDYDRLGVRHAVRYACERCSRRKQAEREVPLDAAPGSA